MMARKKTELRDSVNWYLSSKMSRVERNSYINMSIRSEADMAMRTRDSVADGYSPGFDPDITAETHDEMRTEIASVMTDLRRSNAVLVEEKTGESLVRLDYDGKMSQLMEVDVPSYYGTTRESRGVARGSSQVPGHVSPTPLPNEPVHVSKPLAETMEQIIERRRAKYLPSEAKTEEAGTSGPELG